MLTSKETGSCKTAELACQILSSACSIDNLLTTKWPATVILQPEAGALKLTAELDRRPSCDNRRCFADPAHSLKVAPPPKTLQYKASYARSVDLGSYCSYPHQLMASQAEAYLQQLKDIGYVVFQLLNLQETHAAKQHIQSKYLQHPAIHVTSIAFAHSLWMLDTVGTILQIWRHKALASRMTSSTVLPS